MGTVIALIAGLLGGFGGAYIVLKNSTKKETEKLVSDAEKEAEQIKKDKILNRRAAHPHITSVGFALGFAIQHFYRRFIHLQVIRRKDQALLCVVQRLQQFTGGFKPINHGCCRYPYTLALKHLPYAI